MMHSKNIKLDKTKNPNQIFKLKKTLKEKIKSICSTTCNH